MAQTGSPRPIILVGLMGSGKTTIGRALAERLDFLFIDNDAAIEAEYDATGRLLADQLGVAELHRIEGDQLKNALATFRSEPVVIAAAASVVEDAPIRAQLSEQFVVWLQADPAYLAGRLRGEDHRRSLGLDVESVLSRQAATRGEFFASVADIIIRVDGRSIHDITEDIVRRVVPLPRLYRDLAGWFHLLTAPADYEEEAAFYLAQLQEAAVRPIETILELGSGGGNNASHLKQHASLTLVDISAPMLELSESINPECEHIVGDMRTLRLGRQFDAVFVHDAVDYLTTEDDLRAAIETAALHCARGGAVLFAPDDVAETWTPLTEEGGHRDATRALHYVSHTRDPDPRDSTYVMEMTYRLEEDGQTTRVIEDVHELGLFPRATWLEALRSAGLVPSVVPFDHSELEHVIDVFVATPAGGPDR